jgi:peroxiredoxin
VIALENPITMLACTVVLALGAGPSGQAREGDELVGHEAPAWGDLEWINTEPISIEDLRGKVVLIRFWTDTCPYCAASAPALNRLHEEFADRGLVVIGMYHPKPRRRSVTREEVEKAADRLGFEFPVALDLDWRALYAYWLSTGRRSATSSSFVIDRDGIIRHVHPGPEFHDGDDPAPRRDYLQIREAITRLLDEED